MDRMQGSMGTLSAMQLTADTRGLDVECKMLLHRKEVISVILKGTVEEYADYSLEEIMDFIEADSIEEAKEVSSDRTNARVRGDNAEFAQLNEKVSFFDMLFRAKNPALSKEGIQINLHIDIEPQKTYRPGCPIEKRGLYYLARSLSTQLSLITEQTDYRGLEKCYSIWICRDDIPKKEQYSVSFYEIANTKNIGNCITNKEDYDDESPDISMKCASRRLISGFFVAGNKMFSVSLKEEKTWNTSSSRLEGKAQGWGI